MSFAMPSDLAATMWFWTGVWSEASGSIARSAVSASLGRLASKRITQTSLGWRPVSATPRSSTLSQENTAASVAPCPGMLCTLSMLVAYWV